MPVKMLILAGEPHNDRLTPAGGEASRNWTGESTVNAPMEELPGGPQAIWAE